MKSVFKPQIGNKPGFLVLSGLDGTGKSSQASILAEHLRNHGSIPSIIWNRWNPALTGPFIKLAKRRLNPREDAAITDYNNFTASKQKQMRNPHKRNLWQVLVWSEYLIQVHYRLSSTGYPNQPVISDRYVYDTIVDIAINFSLPSSRLDSLCNHKLFTFFPRPSCVIFLDIDPEVGATRKSDGTPTAYLADRRKYYLELANIMKVPVVNANNSIDAVSEEIWKHAKDWVKNFTVC